MDGVVTPTAAAASGDAPFLQRARTLWASLPSDFAQYLRPHVPKMARAVVEEIQQAVPEYAKPLDGPVGEVLVKGVREAIWHCLRNIADPGAVDAQWREMFRLIGKIEFTQGRSLDCLQASYRVGGRVAWRWIAALGQRHHLPPETLYVAAEAILAYIDELSTVSIEGYTMAQSKAAGTIARRRRRLLELILAVPQAPADALASLAAAADWPLPETVTPVALEPRKDQHRLAVPQLSERALIDCESSRPCMLLAGSAGPPEADELGGWCAAVGPAVPVTEAARSLQLARRCITLMQRGYLDRRQLTWYADHLPALWLTTDEFLIEQMRHRILAPLHGCTVKQRARLSETLLAWLQSRDSAPELARTLHVHPQTVRYRMHQIEDLFGTQLRDPERRLELEIALRAELLGDPA